MALNDQERAVRLVDALAELIGEGHFVTTVTEVSSRAQVTKAVARTALRDWFERGWVTLVGTQENVALFGITTKAPGAPNEAAISAVSLLQVMGTTKYERGRLTYGYGSALSYHELSQLVISDIYVCELDKTVKPPKYADGAPTEFKKSTKEPTVWGPWQNRRVYKLRRSAAMMRPQYRTMLPFQGVQVPCTTAARTLVDCWLRPDLAGGEDRMADAWSVYLTRQADGSAPVAAEVASVLRDSEWPAMTEAFMAWLQAFSPALAAGVAARLTRE